jgi:hypothetical protein
MARGRVMTRPAMSAPTVARTTSARAALRRQNLGQPETSQTILGS